MNVSGSTSGAGTPSTAGIPAETLYPLHGGHSFLVFGIERTPFAHAFLVPTLVVAAVVLPFHLHVKLLLDECDGTLQREHRVPVAASGPAYLTDVREASSGELVQIAVRLSGEGAGLGDHAEEYPAGYRCTAGSPVSARSRRDVIPSPHGLIDHR